MSFGTTVVIALFLSAPPLDAASFDCTKTATQVEKLICADKEISDLDDRLAAAYKQALDMASNKEGLKQLQIEWLKSRDTCKDQPCLKARYEARITQLASASQPANVAATHTGYYALVKGKGVEVCEQYEKNLNSFHLDRPMICERRINPQMKDFRKPDWVQPGLDQARALEFDMAKLVSRVLNRPEPKNESEIKVRMEDDPGWPAKREIARVDIDNDGALDIVLKQQDGTCPEHRVFEVTIAILSKDGKRYDLDRSKYIDASFARLDAQMRNDSSPERWPTAGLARDEIQGGMLYDVFLYKGVTYFDLWEMGKDYPNPTAGRLHVFLHKGKKTQEICTYRFQ